MILRSYSQVAEFAERIEILRDGEIVQSKKGKNHDDACKKAKGGKKR